MSDGNEVLFAFVNDSEKGPILVVSEDLEVGACIDLAKQAEAHFASMWRNAIQQRTAELANEKKEPARLIGLNGDKLA